MPRFTSSHVEVYVFRRTGRRVEFLALRRSPGRKLPGVWQPVTGRRRPAETPLAAAVREVLEETALVPTRWWALETMPVFYEADSDAIVALPLFAAEVAPGAEPRLSGEHDAHAFLTAAAAGRRFLWEAQRRGLAAVRSEVLNGGALADALEVTGRLPQRRRRPERRPEAHPGRPRR